MDFKVVWTDPAIADLEAIVRFIAAANPEASFQIGTEILRHVEVLSTFPFIGPVYPRDTGDRHREIVCGQYRVFYRVQEEARVVEILTVWPGRRAEPKLP